MHASILPDVGPGKGLFQHISFPALLVIMCPFLRGLLRVGFLMLVIQRSWSTNHTEVGPFPSHMVRDLYYPLVQVTINGPTFLWMLQTKCYSKHTHGAMLSYTYFIGMFYVIPVNTAYLNVSSAHKMYSSKVTSIWDRLPLAQSVYNTDTRYACASAFCLPRSHPSTPDFRPPPSCKALESGKIQKKLIEMTNSQEFTIIHCWSVGGWLKQFPFA